MLLRILGPVMLSVLVLSSCTRTRGGPANESEQGSDAAARAKAEKEVLDAEHEWVNVTLRGDADAFADFLADEYVALGSSGRFVDKATWTDGIRQGSTRYDAVELRDLKVRFPREDVAVVTGAFSQTGVSDGANNSRDGVYINTWIRLDDRWRIVSSGFAHSPSSPEP